ncbi:6-phosphogluconolactonase [Tepidanaerobacter sp. GT38]|uniref:6-phosphogluconolactonase n=1 Tax=Tepidanaerobacter sp. GT38 TaxID=2722793 RepID=UPI001F00D60E|nr:6-phosphogluconolactonase [Tepidanaerobacter sp. GT38]
MQSIDQIPTEAITMGLGSIMKAKKILLLASGKNKAPIIARLIKDGVVTTQNPASFCLFTLMQQ